MKPETIGLAIVVVIWVISSLIKGFKSLLRQTNPTSPLAPPPSQAPLPSQTPSQAQNPFQGQPGQAAPQALRPGQSGPGLMTPAQARQQQAAFKQQARTQPRQPAAGGPAVLTETNRQDFVRQEQELFASEPTSLGVSLSSPAARSGSSPNMLFSGTDDLVRAIILSEVLGPPLSRRQPLSVQPPQQAALPQTLSS